MDDRFYGDMHSTLGSGIAGGRDYGAKAAVAEPDLVRIQGQLHSIRDRLDKLGGRSLEVGDRIFGSQPETASGVSAQPMRSGVVGGIEDVIDGIRSRVDFLDANIERLSRLA